MRECCDSHYAADASRFDPTGTTRARLKFERDLVRRFRKIRALIIQSVARNDVFGLKRDAAIDELQVSMRLIDVDPLNPREFQFSRNADKVALFMRWLKRQQAEGIFDLIEGTPLENAAEQSWMNIYIDTAYQKGLRDAGRALQKSAAGELGEGFFTQAFFRPIHADAVGLAYTRAFTELQGITEAMDQKISRALSTGIAEGIGSDELARRLAREVKDVGIVRARALARTEMVAAHSEASLNMYQEAGVEDVEAIVEFTTSGGEQDGVCPICLGLRGIKYTLEQARGIIPVHPNCRCAWVPVLVGDAASVERMIRHVADVMKEAA